MAGLLDPREGDGTWVENRPSKWQQTWDIFSPYITGPAYAVKGLMDTPLEVLLGAPGTEAAQDEAVANAFNVAGAVTGGSSVVPKPANALNMGIRAFHGSPHSFPPVRLIEMQDGTRLYQNMDELADTPQGARIIQEYPMGRFDMSKIGTGEGAQAYGHGLYFAENENIAKGYRDALTDPEQVKIRINDKHIPSVWVDDLRNTFPEMYKGLRPDDQDIMDSLLGTMESAYSIEDAARAAESVGGRAKTLFNQRVKPFVTKPEVGPGSMYEVDINADPEKFLDWHKPLNEQTQYVKDALGGGIDLNNWGHKTGEDLVKYGLANGHRQFLMEREVPGIKYLANDGSRSAGEGARNYVVFDDNLIEILRKYGIAGLLGGGAAMSAMGQPQEQY